MEFRLKSDYRPRGDQPEAIDKLCRGIMDGAGNQVLLGVTGSGKTFTVANVIAKVNKPVLVISHNKTLTAQLYTEFREFFPENAVEYFVSYYDYYQPEAYIPRHDTYIEKDSSINEQIDKLRLKATSSLLGRKDVIIVSSVSCIYGLGSPEDYQEMVVSISKGQELSREEVLGRLVDIRYKRNDTALERGKFRVRGDVIEIHPAYLDRGVRIELFGDRVEKISEFDTLTGRVTAGLDGTAIFPATHFVVPGDKMERAIRLIKEELRGRLAEFDKQGKFLEAQRLEQRTNFDIEMMQELGYTQGIENYSRHISGRKPGQRPFCLFDYFPDDFLLIIDESHVTIPQLNGMYNGDYSRKKTLVDFGFRLPSALDNRPLKFKEFEELSPQVIYVSATPREYELGRSNADFRKGPERSLYPGVVEQIIRPTGLVDPFVEIRPVRGQVDDLMIEVGLRAAKKERVLVTTLTKRMAEDLSGYFTDKGLRVKYLHSGIKTLDRVDILNDLRKGNFDCLVGVNLLREGLDLPEVSLIAILDADKEGFLRSETSLIQICGRAARNVNGRVIMYADNETGSMKRAIREMSRRRKKQEEFNRENGIVPETIRKDVREYAELAGRFKKKSYELVREVGYRYAVNKNASQLGRDLRKQMKEAADNLDFELAAILRDRIFELEGLKKKKK